MNPSSEAVPNFPTNQVGPSGAVTPSGQAHPHNEGAQVSTITVQTAETDGYPFLVGVLMEVATDEQIETVLSVCREHAHEGDGIAHAISVLEQRGRECPECRGSGKHALPDPEGWSARQRVAPDYETCDGCEGSGRVTR